MNTVDGNFVDEYLDYAERCTNTDPKYHKYCAYTILSQTVLGDLTLDTPYATYDPNLWVCLIGESTLTKKTTSMNLAKEVVEKAGISKFLPTEFSPEGLTKNMAENPIGYMWIDEIGSLLKQLGRDYMSSGKELMMKLYSGQNVVRSLSQEQIVVKNPSLGMIGTTTPSTILEAIGRTDMFTGYSARMLHIYHDVDYEWSGMSRETKNLMSAKSDLADTLKLIYNKFNTEKKAVMTDDAVERYNKWDKTMMNNLDDDDHVSELSSITGRIREHCIKIAMIEEIAETWDSIKATEDIIYLNKDSIEKSIVMMNKYHSMISKKVLEILHGDERMKVYNTISDEEPVSRSRLLRKTHMKSSQLNKVMSTLKQMHLVKKELDTSSDNPKNKKLYRTTEVGLK